ncbi:MAG: helix-turn-helix transcriptional regulator [Fimbriimonadaceae bacterium]|nr:helix-turn-helix transcriptional regulator [Fimbriimonadaceae bacterium]
MSSTRQPENDQSVVRFWTLDHPGADEVAWPPLEWPMLAYAESGVMSVESASMRWVVPPHRAMWIPRGERWTMRTKGALRIRSLYFAPETLQRDSGVIEVRPFLRELIREACLVGPLSGKSEIERALITLLASEIATVRVLPYSLPIPAVEIDAIAADKFLDDPSQFPDVAAFAESESVSIATLDRRFQKSLGMSVGRWMQAGRLHIGLREVLRGVPIAEAAFAAGYASASSFGAAFRKQYGMTPAQARAHPDQ